MERPKKTILLWQIGVKFEFAGQPLLLVVKGWGEKPMMVLTNVAVKSQEVMRILEIYLTLRKCEESHHFIKNSYNLENVCASGILFCQCRAGKKLETQYSSEETV